jgi:hypothetical protein
MAVDRHKTKVALAGSSNVDSTCIFILVTFHRLHTYYDSCMPSRSLEFGEGEKRAMYTLSAHAPKMGIWVKYHIHFPCTEHKLSVIPQRISTRQLFTTLTGVCHHRNSPYPLFLSQQGSRARCSRDKNKRLAIGDSAGLCTCSGFLRI